MDRREAFDYCTTMGRKLAQPRNQAENTFYGGYAREFYRRILENNNGGNKTKPAVLDKLIKEAKV